MRLFKFDKPNVKKLRAANDIEGLISALTDDDGHIREEAQDALIGIGPPAVGSLIQSFILHDKGERGTTEKILEKIGSANVVSYLKNQGTSVIASLIEAASIDNECRRYLIPILGELRERSALELFIQSLRDKDSKVREAAAHALGKLSDTRAIDPLIRSMRLDSKIYIIDQDMRRGEQYPVRDAAAEALIRIREPAIQPLFDVLEKEDGTIEERAYTALIKIGKPALPGFTHVLNNGTPLFRQHAAMALARIKDAEAVDSLLVHLDDSDVETRKEVVRALGEIGDPKAVEPLFQALCDGVPEIRSEAANSLGKIGDPRAVDPLIHTFSDAETGVREQATIALKRVWDSRAVKPLIKALVSEDSDVRYRAAIALGEMRDKLSVEPLIEILSDTSPLVRRAAATALGNIQDRRAIEPLRKLVKEEKDADVLETAKNALNKTRLTRDF